MPRKAIVVLLSLISLLGLGLATPGAQAQLTQPYVSQATGITFPVEMEGLRLIRITDFEPRQRGLGVGIYYRNDAPLVQVDIFIYDKNGTVPSGHEPAPILAEIDQAIADIHSVAASGLYADVQLRYGPSPCKTGGLVFQCADLIYLRTPQGQAAVPTNSRILLRGVRGNFVKVRVSWPQAQHPQSAPIAERWLNALGRVLPN